MLEDGQDRRPERDSRSTDRRQSSSRSPTNQHGHGLTAYQAIAALRQHIRPTERIHGIITNGGQAPNIVPERADGRFFVRAPSVGELEPLKKRVTACFEAGALATGTQFETAWGAVDYEATLLESV